MDQDPQILTVAFKKAARKLARINELGIVPGMSPDDVDNLVTDLATAKAIEQQSSISAVINGQQWYVQGLLEFADMTVLEQLDFEYHNCFADSASKEQMLERLGQLG